MIKRWWLKGLVVATAVSTVACTSMEDRIENVVHHHLEQCKQSDDLFFTVTTRGSGSYEVLAELCHLEPSEVEMNNEWRGTIRTGPLVWLAEEDQDERAVLLRRVAWDQLDRAVSHAGRENPEEEDYEAAERHFSNAEEQYGESSWVKTQRLKNLLAWRGATYSEDDGESIVGDDAEAYLASLIDWANEQGDTELVMEARLAVIDQVNTYVERQQRALRGLGSRDEWYEAVARNARNDGDEEAAREYEETLEQRRAERPEAQERLEARILTARREACGYVDQLNVDGVSRDGLRAQISNIRRNYDCNLPEEGQEEGE